MAVRGLMHEAALRAGEDPDLEVPDLRSLLAPMGIDG
jgi:hypothetical protein